MIYFVAVVNVRVTVRSKVIHTMKIDGKLNLQRKEESIGALEKGTEAFFPVH